MVPNDIGGRYSVLSAVGIVPLVLARLDVKTLMEGLHRFFTGFKDSAEVGTHPVLRYAASRHLAYKSGKTIESLSYINSKLFYFLEWLKQMFGESEGKDVKGLFPTGLVFMNYLHSLGQYVQEVVINLFETFLHFDESIVSHGEAVEQQLKVHESDGDLDKISYIEGVRINEINHGAMLATKVAHFDGGVPCINMKAPQLNEYTIGGLFPSLQQRVISVS